MKTSLLVVSTLLTITAWVSPLLAADELIVAEKTALRLFPEKSSNVVYDLRIGDRVTVLQQSGPFVFCQISKNGQVLKGWLPADHLAKPKSSNEKSVELTGDSRLVASDSSRSFWFPTAINQRKGTSSAKGYYFLGWDFDFAITDTTTIGLRTAVPIGFIGLGPYIRQSIDLSPMAHVSVMGGGGFIASLIEKNDTQTAYAFGGGAMFTLGDAKGAFTVGSFLLGAGTSHHYGHLLSMNANAFYRMTNKIKALIELMLPMATHRETLAGKWAFLQYGIRYCGESISGDIGFIVPIYDDMGELMRYAPLGIPALSFSIFW